MNKKRKILTLVALAVFSVIIALHYTVSGYDTHIVLLGGGHPKETYIEDVRTPLFALGVFYAGLFAILGDSKRKEQ